MGTVGTGASQRYLEFTKEMQPLLKTVQSRGERDRDRERQKDREIENTWLDLKKSHLSRKLGNGAEQGMVDKWI